MEESRRIVHIFVLKCLSAWQNLLFQCPNFLTYLIYKSQWAVYPTCSDNIHKNMFLSMGVGTGGTGGTCRPPPPPNNFAKWNSPYSVYALLSRKLAHKMFIFNKIFRLASLADQDTSNLKIYKFKCSNYFTSFSSFI